MDRLRLALVGCGRISGKHFQAIKENPEIQLVAVCDSNEEKVQLAGKEQGCLTFIDYETMLDQAKPDAIAICTPNYLHPPMAIAAAKRKIHCLTEKPMALSLKDAKAMIAACKNAKVELFVIKQNRYNPPVIKLKEAIDKGRFGKLFIGSVVVRWQRPQEYYDDDWHGKIAHDGGMLLNQASHHVDMLQWLFGPARSVQGNVKRLARKIETEDTAAALITFKSGAIGVIEATTLTFPRNIEGSITIQGENGTVKIGGTAMNKVEIWEFRDFTNEDDKVKNMQFSQSGVYGNGHAEVYRNVVDCLLHGKKCDVDGDEGYKSLELILAIYKAGREGKTVTLPLPEDESVMNNKGVN